MQRLTDEQLDEIRKRAEASTAKYWTVKYGIGEGAEVNTSNGFGGTNICVTQQTADAEFIASAKQDIPMLLADIEQLNDEANYWRMEHEHQRKQAEMYIEKYKRAKGDYDD